MAYLVMHEVTGSESVFMSTFDTLRKALRRCLELAQAHKRYCKAYHFRHFKDIRRKPVRELYMEKSRWRGHCTLDGKRAHLSGASCKHATVWEVGNISHQVEFSWAAVKRIMDNGGEFKS